MTQELIFISWSGDKSGHYATCFRKLLKRVIQGSEAYLSSEDNRAGMKWFINLSAALEKSKFCVAFVTNANKDDHWIHFEAGACAKEMSDSSVVPICIDLAFSDLIPPLSHFTAKNITKESMRDVLKCINVTRMSPIADDVLNDTFDAFWPEFESCVAEFKDCAPPKDSRKPEEKIDEVLEIVRAMQREGARGVGIGLPLGGTASVMRHAYMPILDDPELMRRHRALREFLQDSLELYKPEEGPAPPDEKQQGEQPKE